MPSITHKQARKNYLNRLPPKPEKNVERLPERGPEYVWLSHAGHPQHRYPYRENTALCGRVTAGPGDIGGEQRPKCKACIRLGKLTGTM